MLSRPTTQGKQPARRLLRHRQTSVSRAFIRRRFLLCLIATEPNPCRKSDVQQQSNNGNRDARLKRQNKGVTPTIEERTKNAVQKPERQPTRGRHFDHGCRNEEDRLRCRRDFPATSRPLRK